MSQEILPGPHDETEESKLKSLITGPFGKWALRAGVAGAVVLIARGLYLSKKHHESQRTELLRIAQDAIKSTDHLSTLVEFGDAIRAVVGEKVPLSMIDGIIKDNEDEKVRDLFQAFRETIKKPNTRKLT